MIVGEIEVKRSGPLVEMKFNDYVEESVWTLPLESARELWATLGEALA